MVNINDRVGVLSGLVNRGIKNYFKSNPVKDNTELLEKMNDKIDELYVFLKHLSEKSSGETVIELDTK
mgnify:CR=1 FL=1